MGNLVPLSIAEALRWRAPPWGTEEGGSHAGSRSCLFQPLSPLTSLPDFQRGPFGREVPGCPISWGRRKFPALRRSQLSQPFLASALRALVDLKETSTSQLALGSQTGRRGGQWGADNCQVSPVLAQNLPETCQTGMSWQPGPFGQVMTFWTLLPLYTESGEHSLCLRGRIKWSGQTALWSTDSGTPFKVLEKVWWTNSTLSLRRAPQGRGDRKFSGPHGSVSGGVCNGCCDLLVLCWLPASCPPFCVLQVLEASKLHFPNSS